MDAVANGATVTVTPAGEARTRRLVCVVFALVFAMYALNYAYFFVDDEAIPFVYAQNILHGHGLVYNPDDGPVEGYSDFLTVWIDVAILGIVTLTGASKLTAFAIAELFAFSCGVAVVALTFKVLSRRLPADPAAIVAGMTFLVLAGPLAVWSWAALETTLFALITITVVIALLDIDSDDDRTDRKLLLLLTALMLCRSDGFVWAGALVAPFLVSTTPARRRVVIRRVILPAVAVFGAYQAWRLWYFGELLPMPVYAKVLYKLGRHETFVSNDPPVPYVLAFLRSYYWIPVGILWLGFLGAYRRSPAIRALAVAIVLVGMYLSIVGDWMFGFRFFVPLLAPLAIVAAAGFSDLRARYPRAGLAALAIWIAALSGIAYQFWRTYARQEERQSWLAAPSLDPHRFFAPYYQVLEAAREYVGPNDTIAYNQAGFVPFMLDARNIDDLGVCTKFYAKLPTTDVVFTEVGRYSPLTDRPVMSASETYTLSRAPRLLLEPAGNIRAANRGRVPQTVLGGTYRLLFATSAVAAYGATTGYPEPSHDPSQYLENLVHISHLRRAWINGQVLTTAEYRRELPYLYRRQIRLMFDDRYVADFTFSQSDEDVRELHIGSIRSATDATLVVMLLNASRHEAYSESFELGAREWREFHVRLPDGLRASVLSLAITPHAPGSHAVDLDDVRVQGQTPALKRFLKK